MFQFFHLRGHRSSASYQSIHHNSIEKPDKEWMSYHEFMEFVDTHMYLARSSPNLLSKADISKIFIAVKSGGGRGVHQDQIDNSEFKTCLVLLALCGTRACEVLPPIVHTIAESRSSTSLRSGDFTRYTNPNDKKPPIPPVDKLKWLLRRIFNSPVARESKARHLVKFRSQFADMLNADGRF